MFDTTKLLVIILLINIIESNNNDSQLNRVHLQNNSIEQPNISIKQDNLSRRSHEGPFEGEKPVVFVSGLFENVESPANSGNSLRPGRLGHSQVDEDEDEDQMNIAIKEDNGGTAKFIKQLKGYTKSFIDIELNSFSSK